MHGQERTNTAKRLSATLSVVISAVDSTMFQTDNFQWTAAKMMVMDMDLKYLVRLSLPRTLSVGKTGSNNSCLLK